MTSIHCAKATGIALTAAALLATTTACGPVSADALTIAATATSHEPGIDLTAVTERAAEHARASMWPGDGVVRIVTQGNPTVTIDATPLRGEDVETVEAKAAQLIDASMSDVAAAAGIPAATEGLDALGTLDQALEDTPKGGHIYLYTSGLNTTAPINLAAHTEWIDDPHGFAAAIDPEHLPDAHGRSITFIGLGYGDPAGAQPSAPIAARKSLEVLWLDICERTGADECKIIDGTPASGQPTGTLSVPLITWPSITDSCTGTLTLDAEVAFEARSAQLTDAADAILAPIATTLAGCPAGRVVNADGHTAAVPGETDNGIAFSQLRAQHVLDRLLQLGAPASTIGTATGHGNTQPLVDNMPGGVFDAARAALNRRVELTIVTTTGTR